MDRHVRILFIEDSDSDLQLMVRILKKAGCEVSFRQAENRGEMLAELQRQDVDLVISDYNLPGFSGAEALRLLRDIKPELPFIAVSSTFNEQACARMKEAGASECLVKSSLFAQLAVRVTRLMGWPLLPDPQDCDESAFESCRAVFDAQEFEQYLYQVMNTARTSLEEMERLYDQQELAAMAYIAHRIKSPCSNIGARALARALGELEAAAGQGRTQRMTDLLLEAWSKLDEFQGFLNWRRDGAGG